MEGRILDEAIDSRVEEIGPNPDSGRFDHHQTRSVDALVEMAATGNGVGSSIHQVTVFADLEALTTETHGSAEWDNTAPSPNQTAQRLACDATVRTIIRDGARVVGIGRKSRRIPDWLRELVYKGDGGRSQHPGCRHTRWLQTHSIQPWAHGGPTDLDNLILLCGFHHRQHHEHGWAHHRPTA